MSTPIQAVLYILSALILLRLSGKKTMSKMTPSEVVIMIGIGTLLVHPLKVKNSWLSIYHGALIIIGLIIYSFILLYFPVVKQIVMGNPILLIQDGKVIITNLKKARMTLDELKMRLRIKKINDISKVRMATLEVSGELGIELFPDDSFVTKKEFNQLKEAINLYLETNNESSFNHHTNLQSIRESNNLFDQVKHLKNKQER